MSRKGYFSLTLSIAFPVFFCSSVLIIIPTGLEKFLCPVSAVILSDSFMPPNLATYLDHTLTSLTSTQEGGSIFLRNLDMHLKDCAL